MTRPLYQTPAQRIKELVELHGSYRKAAEATGTIPGALHKAESGRVLQPRRAFLEAIGLDPDTAAFCRLQSSGNRRTKETPGR